MLNQGYILENYQKHQITVDRAHLSKEYPSLAFGARPGSGEPVVINLETKRAWVLTWDELFRLAIEAGLNNTPP